MKSIILTLIIFALTSCFNKTNESKKNNVEHTRISEKEIYKKISDNIFLIDSLRRDVSGTVISLNKQLVDTLIKYKESVFDLKDTLNYDLIYVAKSKDKKICFISWDTRQGGTNIDYATILFYKTTVGVQAKYLIDSNQNNTQIHYNEIFELNDKKKIIYLGRGFGQGSTALPWEEIIAYSLIDGELTEENIFPSFENRDTFNPNTFTKSHYSNKLFIEFDTHNCIDEEPCPVCIFSRDIKTIKIPKTNNKGGHTKEFYTIKYKNGKFE